MKKIQGEKMTEKKIIKKANKRKLDFLEIAQDSIFNNEDQGLSEKASAYIDSFFDFVEYLTKIGVNVA